MNTKKLISYTLSLVMLMSVLTAFISTAVFAAGEDNEITVETYDYLGDPFESADEKLATMQLYFENDEYAIYGLEETGEVGIVDKTSGQIMLTNPYDVASSKSSEAIKQQLLSQIILTYSDAAGTVVSFNSFADAAFASEETKQIFMKKTRDGLRVEYTIGREATKYIVPRQIEKEAFERDILAYLDKDSRAYAKITSYYELKDPNQPGISQSSIDAMKMKWPITEKYAIYVLDPNTGSREFLELEGYMKSTYYDDYSKVEEMYEMLDYVDTSVAPALFRFAIEYSLDEQGIKITLPASSIRYDSSNYTLESVKFLPYFCAGSNKNTGFTLIPDGSGAITRFEDIADKAFTLTGKLYGRDYSFHSISGTYQETMRLPVFGVLENTTTDVAFLSVNEPTAEQTESVETSEMDVVADKASSEPKTTSAGYVAYLVEGDAMAEITADHGGTIHKYSSVYTTFYPKPSDTYVLEGISTTGSAVWNVQSERRYTGNYTLRIFPINGDDCDYNDMAAEVRDYLVNNGTFEKMKASDDKSEDVSLYIENFGTIETSQKIAGFPVNVQTPLTTFEQTQDMLTELKENGINNVKVKLTGWYNGGLVHTAPAKLKVESAVGGAKGLKNLAEYASENNISIYPDLDFVYVDTLSSFDGFDYKKHSVKTIDNRSAAYRKYSPLYQGFEDKGMIIISATAMSEFYNNIKDDFAKFGTQGISVGTLGSQLSSDHNEDYTLNREDVKTMVTGALSNMKEDMGSIMVDGGNSYVLPYVDHILGVSLDSSLNINTSESIPFVGMILHGNVEFAGSAINLDGDYKYSVLKAIENGANLYFMLSKDNTSELKQFEKFSKYYAISYDIWKEDLVDTYSNFNDAMKQVKYSYITDHETIDTRVVKVVYENGIGFVLNYNTHPVEVEGITVDAMSFAQFSK